MISAAFVWVLVWIPFTTPAPVQLWTFTTAEQCEVKRAQLPDAMVRTCTKVPVE